MVPRGGKLYTKRHEAEEMFTQAKFVVEEINARWYSTGRVLRNLSGKEIDAM